MHASKAQRAGQALSLANVLCSMEAGDDSAAPVARLLDDALRLIRNHLGMDVAFLSEFANGRRIFRHVNAAHSPPIAVGQSHPLASSVCQRIVEGELPELMPDVRNEARVLDLPVASMRGMGAHLGVPIRLASGRVFGTLCCFAATPDYSLGERDLGMLRVFAAFAAREIERELELNRVRDELGRRIRQVLADGAFAIHYQPIYHLGREAIVGFEALARFAEPPGQAPDLWFSQAAQAGLGVEFEVAAVRRALDALAVLPPDVYVSVNVSPATVLSGALAPLFAAVPLERVALEVTEHVSISEYAGFAAVLGPLRARGLRLAIDDAGAGYASFRHIIELDPDLIKLDLSLTRDIDSNLPRRALAAALIRFAEETGSRIVAEGVETKAELASLRQLGVKTVQGFLTGRPLPLAATAELFTSAMSMR